MSSVHIFTEITFLICIAALVSIIMRALRQPLIIGHIFTGLLVGPSFLGLVKSPETVGLMGEFGIALLLFVVGLGLNPKIIKEVGKVSLLTGLGQVGFTIVLAYVMVSGLGYSSTEAVFISVALAFSSTIIILKLLNDKKEQNKLYGKISIGFLLVQDVIATIALVIAAALSRGGLSYEGLATLMLTGIGLGIGIFLISKFILKPLTSFLAKSQELLFLFALAWSFGIGTLFYELGFSLEVGALIAGIALANMTYAQEVASRLKPLRDFFLVVFFIALGSRLNISNFQDYLLPALAMSALVLIGNPIIVMSIMGLLGYTKKTSFKAGLAVAQISEFSLIFLLLGQRNGQIDASVVSVVTLVAIITIAVSSYLIIYSDSLYALFDKNLSLFERKKKRHEAETSAAYEAILIGYKKGGHEFVRVFSNLTKRFVVVDYDPDATDELERKNIPYLYGDATDMELLDELNLSRAKLVVSTVSDHESNIFLLKYIDSVNPSTVVVCHADNAHEAAELYGLGASYVMMPTFIGSEKISAFIRKNGFSKTEFGKHREKHIAYLQSHYDSESDA